MSITLPTLSLPSILLATGTMTTSYVLFSQVGDTQRGIIPLLNGRMGTLDPELTPTQRVRLWNAYFNKGIVQIVGTSMVSMAINLTTAYIHPSPLVRRLTLAAGVGSLLILPMTPALGLLPINSSLQKYEQTPPTKADEDRVKELIAQWESRHVVRYISYFGAWAASFAALVCAGPL